MPKGRVSGSERWRSSERIATAVLEELGFRVLESHKRLEVYNTEVGEVDFIAEDGEGTKYAVEVKAGRLDVTGVRQAYVNAVLLGMKPMVVCKGFTDSAAEALAKELGVRVIKLSDIFLVEQEELEVLLREVVEQTLEDFFILLLSPVRELTSEQERVLEAIASTRSISDAASRLGLDVGELAKKIDALRSQGVIPRWASRYSSVKRVSELIMARRSLSTITKPGAEGSA